MGAPHKGTIKRKMFPFDDVAMYTRGFDLLFSNQMNRSCSAFDHILLSCFTARVKETMKDRD